MNPRTLAAAPRPINPSQGRASGLERAMHEAPPQFAGACPAPVLSAAPGRLERFGLWLRDHQREVRALQWVMVALYLPLLQMGALI